MLKAIVHVVQNWFDRAGGGGLVLPDGWFGRPYDNIHRLNAIESNGDLLRIELDDRLVLTFKKPSNARICNSELLVEDFESLSFDWKEYGSNEKHSTSYQNGVVTFVPPIGTVLA